MAMSILDAMPPRSPLRRLGAPALVHDACGVGFLADLEGRRRADLLPLALTALARMAHRGAVDADGRTGDGAGVTTGIPYELLMPQLAAAGRARIGPRDLAVGALFLPGARDAAARARALVVEALRGAGLGCLGFRAVPIREAALGDKARRSRPGIEQVLVERPAAATDADFARALEDARQAIERRANAAAIEDLYVVSLSHGTLVYKALVRAVDLSDFYPDLQDHEFRTAFALFHQRFSTNTAPSWALVQPFRLLAHNGEINTIQGNRAWMKARGCPLSDDVSDSASLDEALALLTRGGRDVLHAMSLLVPPAWEGDDELPADVRAFFDYQACLMEPWDGPALVAFTDGRVVGAALDRNGLRPARYLTTVDGLVMVASEAGVLDVEDERVLHRGRLGPGDVVAVDLPARRLVDREALHRRLAARRPYGRWLAEQRLVVQRPSLPIPLPRVGEGSANDPGREAPSGTSPGADLAVLRAFGYTREELQLILGPMYRDGLEPLGSMGDDTPLAVLSSRPRLLFCYFKQRFAQVTNPPIDPLRESLVMSLRVQLGPQGELLAETPAHAAQVHLAGPLLRADELRRLEALERKGWRTQRLSLLFAAQAGTPGLAQALEALLSAAAEAVRRGATLLILDDQGVGPDRAALPSLLAVSAVHQHLVREGLRMRASLIVATGEARDDHQLAALIGFGASAVCPYLALAAVAGAVAEQGGNAARAGEAQARYLDTLAKGLLKILSKMGISTLRSYHGAQLFEALGIAEPVIERHFTGTPSYLGGLGLAEIAAEALTRHAAAFAEPAGPLEEGGAHRFRQNGELHAFEPRVVRALHAALRSGQRLDYRRYAELVHARGPLALRDLLEFKERPAIPLEQVEPVEAILPRFTSAAMSLGALSPEAHETLALGMGRLGARSNCGEGGEDGARHRVKQVASGRFGVTAAYLASADELQIKIAQGSKPGEGGQLPGHKVTPQIARVRHAAPGVTLISPPPHHDIYSIEDLAQLIYDLKRVNPRATVGVKLVSEAGIGAVATGVAKAHADAITIGGHDGGTGASPLGSIKNAGTPWELGLAEAQQALVESGLRARVRLQVEGGLRTGRDVAMAALLGAEEYGFGSAALVALGCVMARQCHLNTCPAGVATQREELRAKFRGTPDAVLAFFTAIAEEVREILALLGVSSLAELIGRTELLEVRLPASGKAGTLALERILARAAPSQALLPSDQPHAPPETGGRLDEAVLARLPFASAKGRPLVMQLSVTNADRAVGARVAGELVARRGRRASRPPARIDVGYRGSAGQSFGAFCVDGMRLALEGEANDYVGKGMSGGEIVIRPFASSRLADPVVAGNTVLYGATGGRLFLAGRAGERFAVRNSGALAVVEGVGDHACEYMTGGGVVILGATGRNFGAGMSGGLAYVFDPDALLARRLNPEMVVASDASDRADQLWLREALKRHHEATASARARAILAGWSALLPFFRRVAPREAPAQARPAAWSEPTLGAPPRIARFATHWRRSWRALISAAASGRA
jgi:glutamate synthase domain-containing protein 2/glutamate synthase domain-containing protein 1/glutamate synthase domain-containing protein 3